MKMRTCIFFLGLSLIYEVAHGLDCLVNFYVGAEAQYSYLNVTKQINSSSGTVISRSNNQPLFSENGAAAGLFVGANFNEFIGLEVGYLQFKNSKTQDSLVYNPSVPGITLLKVQSTNTFTAKHHNWYLDVMGCLPIILGVDIVGTVGFGNLTSKLKNVTQATAALNIPPANPINLLGETNGNARSSKVGFRGGVGLQYKVCDLGARLMVRYQNGNDLIKNLTSVAVGLFYQFN